MKIICIEEQFNKNFSNLGYYSSSLYKFPFTVGRIYNVTDMVKEGYSFYGSYFAICDDGTEKIAHKECFITLNEYRQQQLEKIGI